MDVAARNARVATSPIQTIFTAAASGDTGAAPGIRLGSARPRRLATAGAVSLANITATIVISAIAIIRTDTGQVAALSLPTIAAAASGTSPPPMGAAS